MHFRRSAVLGGAALLLMLGGAVAACAKPGSSPQGEATEKPVPVITTTPPKDELPCTVSKVKPTPKHAVTTAVTAEPPHTSPLTHPADENLDEAYRGEMMQRQMRANRMYLDRKPLPEAAIPGAVKCAVSAEEALKALNKAKKFDQASITKALTAKGLPDSTVRKPATHDVGFGDGFTIANWTGQACILGYLSPTHGYHVEYGSLTADGGCLPAAD
ncbi:hypothetical protein [Actinoplanes sp. NPDC026619]|uniref:hypothetical protein n=1 Tax=Actinoplanes sp. NPDC026619 TaxID=3155798 RepID=UPI0033E2EC8C